jgi:hypothetical protein
MKLQTVNSALKCMIMMLYRSTCMYTLVQLFRPPSLSLSLFPSPPPTHTGCQWSQNRREPPTAAVRETATDRESRASD